MLKRLLMGGGIAGVLILGTIIGSLTLAPVFAQTTDANPPAQAAVQGIEDDDAAEAAEQGPDMDSVEEQVGDQNELDDAAEAAVEDADLDNIDNQVEQDGEFDGEF
jgi:hypothetical protein